MQSKTSIKAIIGLGNPGPSFYATRHNIGFRVVEELAKQYHAQFKQTDLMEWTEISINGHECLLIMPQTFMNSSGKVIPFLLKKGIKPENILVIHDELELPFGKLKFKFGTSAKGHNGLKSIIGQIGPDFHRLAIGISRPETKEDVPNYVLAKFKPTENVNPVIEETLKMISSLF